MSRETSVKAYHTTATGHQVSCSEVPAGEEFSLVLFSDVVKKVTVFCRAEITGSSATSYSGGHGGSKADARQ